MIKVIIMVSSLMNVNKFIQTILYFCILRQGNELRNLSSLIKKIEIFT